MIKKIPIFLYGSIIVLVGVFLMISQRISFQQIKLVVGIGLIVGAIFAFNSAFIRQRRQVQFAYHEMHALAMLTYSVFLLFFCNSTERLLLFTSFLLFFYAISEIIFCNWLFNLGQKVVFRIVSVRALLGLAIGIGTVIAMNFSAFTLQIFGALLVLVGINVILYVPVMRISHSIEVSKEI